MKPCANAAALNSCRESERPKACREEAVEEGLELLVRGLEYQTKDFVNNVASMTYG